MKIPVTYIKIKNGKSFVISMSVKQCHTNTNNDWNNVAVWCTTGHIMYTVGKVSVVLQHLYYHSVMSADYIVVFHLSRSCECSYVSRD